MEHKLKIKKHFVFGLEFILMNMNQVLNWISELNNYDKFRYIVTPNTDHVVRYSQNPNIKKYYLQSDLVVCDSKILRLINYLGSSVNIGIIHGSDLTENVFNKLSLNKTITVIGCDERVIQRITQKYKTNQILHYCPPMGFINEPNEIEKCLEFAEANPTDYTFLAVGSPQQEMLAYYLKKRKKAKGLGFCIGASLDFLSGVEKRAPIFIRYLHMEWFYRFCQSPKNKFKRYFIDCPQIFKIYFLELINRNKHRNN